MTFYGFFIESAIDYWYLFRLHFEETSRIQHPVMEEQKVKV